MIPQIMFPLLRGALSAIVGDKVFRDYPGTAKAPYALWSTNANADNTLHTTTEDDVAVYVDVYATTEQQSDNMARLVRDALETQGWVDSVQSMGREPDTGYWRYLITATLYAKR